MCYKDLAIFSLLSRERAKNNEFKKIIPFWLGEKIPTGLMQTIDQISDTRYKDHDLLLTRFTQWIPQCYKCQLTHQLDWRIHYQSPSYHCPRMFSKAFPSIKLESVNNLLASGAINKRFEDQRKSSWTLYSSSAKHNK